MTTRPYKRISKMFKFILFALLMGSTMLYADLDPNNQATGLLSDFEAAHNSWYAVFEQAALWVFFTLALIDWVIEFGFMALRGEFEFGAVFAALVRKILVLGFFIAMFNNSQWLGTIPNSLSQLADHANNGVVITPDSILDNGINIVNTIWGESSIFDPMDSLALFITGLILLIIFALLAAHLIVSMVKLYILLSLAPLVFSLGGLGHTRQMAYNPFFAVIKAGLELMLIKLLMGLAISKIDVLAAGVGTDNNTISSMISMSILLYTLIHMIPGVVESIAAGSLGSNSLSGFSAAGKMAASVAGGAVGGYAATKAAASLASSQGATGLGMVTQTAKNLGSAAANDVRRSMAGENLGGSALGRMAFKGANDPSLVAQATANDKGGGEIKPSANNS